MFLFSLETTLSPAVMPAVEREVNVSFAMLFSNGPLPERVVSNLQLETAYYVTYAFPFGSRLTVMSTDLNPETYLSLHRRNTLIGIALRSVKENDTAAATQAGM